MGRPRKFDCDAVLEGAVDLFRERGFDGVSIPDLTEQLGICRQSLYSNYGDKRGLYLAALDRYGQREVDVKLAVLEQDGSPLANVHEVLDCFESYGADCPNAGCLTGTALVEARQDERTLEVAGAHIRRLEQGFRETLERAQTAGELKPEASPERLARALITTCQGIGLLVRLPDGGDRIRDAVSVLREVLDGSTR